MTPQLLQRILVPVANEDDAQTTCDAIERYFDGGVELHALHVIKKGGGAPDKAPLEARQQQAREIFDLLETRLEGTDYELSTELRYGTSVVDEIVAAIEERDATAVAFTPRPAGRITQLLSGNKTRKLVSTNYVPVIVLPRDGGSA